MQNKNQISRHGYALKTYLKTRLKAHRLTYRELAKKLNVAEVTVKRWMTSQDLSYENLAQICELVDVNPGALFEETLASQWGSAYSEQQEKHFAEKPRHFLIFIKALMGCPYEEIRRLVDMPPEKFQAAVRELEKLEALRFLSKGQVKSRIRGPFRWRTRGTLDKRFFTQIRESLYRHFTRTCAAKVDLFDENKALLFRPFEMYLDEESAREFCSELSRVLLKYRAISHQARWRWGKCQPVAGLLAVDKYDLWADVLLQE